MNIVPYRTPTELEREADLEEARAQEQHAREMQALAQGSPNLRSTLLEWAMHARGNAAMLREQARRR